MKRGKKRSEQRHRRLLETMQSYGYSYPPAHQTRSKQDLGREAYRTATS